MANHSFDNKVGNQRREGGSDSVHNIVSNLRLPYNQRNNKMAAKIGWIIIDWLGIPLSLLGIYLNLDNVKSAIIAILAIIYLMLRTWFYFIKNNQAVREKEYDLWHRELDKIEREEQRKTKTGK